MLIDFKNMDEKVLPKFKNGEGELIAKLFTNELGKVMCGKLEPGSSLGLHTHETSSEVIYILEGTASFIYDDTTEVANAGDCHYCPKGHSHQMMNKGDKTLVFFAVIPEQ